MKKFIDSVSLSNVYWRWTLPGSITALITAGIVREITCTSLVCWF